MGVKPVAAIPIDAKCPKPNAKASGAAVDEFGDLAELIRKFKPTLDRHEQLRKEMLGWYADLPADKSFAVPGARYVVTIGEKADERRILNPKALLKRLGAAIFWKAVRIPLAEVDRHIAEVDRGEFVEKTQTGPRKVSAAALPQAAQRAA